MRTLFRRIDAEPISPHSRPMGGLTAVLPRQIARLPGSSAESATVVPGLNETHWLLISQLRAARIVSAAYECAAAIATLYARDAASCVALTHEQTIPASCYERGPRTDNLSARLELETRDGCPRLAALQRFGHPYKSLFFSDLPDMSWRGLRSCKRTTLIHL